MEQNPQSGVESVHNQVRDPAPTWVIHGTDLTNYNGHLVFDVSVYFKS